MPPNTAHATPPEIDPIKLTDPVFDGQLTEVYVGQGSFSVVCLQLYRGIKVAVKEFQQKVLVRMLRMKQLLWPLLPIRIFHYCLKCVQDHTLIVSLYNFMASIQRQLPSKGN